MQSLFSTHMEVFLHSELLLRDTSVGQGSGSDHGVVDVVRLLLKPDLCLPHVVQDWFDHGKQEPTDEEHGLGPGVKSGSCMKMVNLKQK